ncbi:hypothetical protein BJ165DRAFT_1405364 [Panaeolus papilionaceus]|nr:hypothetical protein BJ165DRAFT_1405364 [Panaeolus papilionaceus]
MQDFIESPTEHNNHLRKYQACYLGYESPNVKGLCMQIKRDVKFDIMIARRNRLTHFNSAQRSSVIRGKDRSSKSFSLPWKAQLIRAPAHSTSERPTATIIPVNQIKSDTRAAPAPTTDEGGIQSPMRQSGALFLALVARGSLKRTLIGNGDSYHPQQTINDSNVDQDKEL